MNPHIAIIISANKKMQFQTKLLLKTLRAIGRCPSYHCTIFVQEQERRQLVDSFLENRAEIVTYSLDSRYKYPWTVGARWNVNPKSDLVLALDCDVITTNSIEEFLQECNDNFRGVIGMVSPFNDSLNQWRELYRLCGVSLPQTLYTYRNFNQDLWANQNDSLCPFYVNHGVLAIPSRYIAPMRDAVKFVLPIINERLYDNYYLAQIATTIAADVAKIPRCPLPIKYNTQAKAGDVFTEDTVFFHYDSNLINNIQDAKRAFPSLESSLSSLWAPL